VGVGGGEAEASEAESPCCWNSATVKKRYFNLGLSSRYPTYATLMPRSQASSLTHYQTFSHFLAQNGTNVRPSHTQPSCFPNRHRQKNPTWLLSCKLATSRTPVSTSRVPAVGSASACLALLLLFRPTVNVACLRDRT
jgi:hypothetical protein